MKKLLLIVLIFLIIGSVGAHEDFNGTADSLLKDTEYNSDIDDDGGMLEVEQNSSIPVEISADEPWSLNVYIDRFNSTVNDDMENAQFSRIDIPASVMIDDNEVPLALGKHKIVYEFKFTNTTSIYRPDAYVSDSGVYFDFNFVRTVKNPQNSIYRFNSQFNIIKATPPTTKTFNLEDINITCTDTLSFNLYGLTSGKVNLYLDDAFFDSFEIEENPYEDEIDTTRLKIGSYNLLCIVESDSLNAEYNITADTSDSMININFNKVKITGSPNRYTAVINTTLNVCKIPELTTVNVDAPEINITYTRSIPVLFEGEGGGNFTVYIDGVKVYENIVLLTWENTVFIPSKNSQGTYFTEGAHDISFEFIPDDKYASFKPDIYSQNNALTFSFLNSKDSTVYLNEKYTAKTKLNIKNKNTQYNPINTDAAVTITHTEDINLKIDGLSDAYNITVYVDDVEIYDEYTALDDISIKTFYERSSIQETNERDIQTGTHTLRFEFKTFTEYGVDAEFRDDTLNFKFTPKGTGINREGVYYQLNTSLIVKDKKKTVHILKVKNNTYFDDTEFTVKMDLYKPEDDDDWDDDDENPIGTQDVGIIVSRDGEILYAGDDLMNLYESLKWNYEFENEKLPKAGVYTIKIINLADNTYDTASFEVKKANRVFNKKYSSDDFNVLFTLDFSPCKDDLNEPCIITLNHVEKQINVKKGLFKNKKEVMFKDIDPGVYTATFTLKGNDIYNDVTLKSKVTVKKQSPQITCHKTGANRLVVEVDISKSKTDAVLTVSAQGQCKKFTVNKNTRRLTVEFDDLKPGTYDVEIDFRGNERYTAKTLTDTIDITSHSHSPATQPSEKSNQTGEGLGNNTGGIGPGTGDSNVSGSGNGTYNGKISLNGKGFNGDLGSQGSGHGDGAKSYEITKNIIKLDENPYMLIIFLIFAFAIFFLSFIYERRDDESEEY